MVRRGPRRKVPGERQLNIDLPGDVLDRLHAYAETVDWPRKRVVELALRRFLRSEGAAAGEGAPV